MYKGCASLHKTKNTKLFDLAPRGGGTGTNGQALTQYIVVDMSRYMTEILEINIEQAWVKVQAGVVKDALNDALKPFGYFFSPELSTSNRATIGGMINTDASGQGSLRYGKTSNHVLSLAAVLIDGSFLQTQALTMKDISDLNDNELASSALKASATLCQQKRQLIEQVFPPLNRFLTGYDLKNAYQPDEACFDITKLLCGSEGTLAFITEAKLNITPIAKARALVNIKYDSFDAALRNAPLMVKANALSVETIDSTVLNLAKEDIVWHSVSHLLTEVEGKNLLGINIVEFAEDSDAKVQAHLEKLTAELDSTIAKAQSGIIGYQICTDLASIELIYGMRKKAVGLLGAMKGKAKPVAFAEDTCVPPENLADFIQDFRALLDAHQLNYGMFGHVDSGVIHVRPALDLCSIEQEALLKNLSDQVVALVARYGGLMWGEHGKGYRAEYGPTFWGEELFLALRKIKQAFDPHNRLNPGKICTPLGCDDELVKVTDPKRGSFDRQIPLAVRDSFHSAIDCNGNGLCFNYERSTPMCPSLRITQDRRHSPKGRAGMVREWLRLLASQGVDPLKLEKELMTKSPSVFSILQRYKHIFTQQADDFSHEVMEVMDGCLACKACATQCPIKVDVPSFRSRFIALYHSRYPRPAKDYLVANIERLLPMMATAPRLVNAVTQPKLAKKLTALTLGYVDTPALSVPSLKQLTKTQSRIAFDLPALQKLSSEELENYVFILQDPFTSFYEANLVLDFIKLVERLGKKPILLPMQKNGKAQHIKGFLREFAKTAKNTTAFLNNLSSIQIPIVGIDPALVLCYRDEYPEILGKAQINFRVFIAHEWLVTQLAKQPQREQKNENPWYLLAHCTEKTKLPNSENDWLTIFAHFGVEVKKVAVGCCGMAGTYGHEANKVDLSKGIYSLSWGEKLATLPKDRCMVTGYSCRSQVKRMENTQILHPLQILLRYL